MRAIAAGLGAGSSHGMQEHDASPCAEHLQASGRPCDAAPRRSKRRLSRHRRRRGGRRRRRRGRARRRGPVRRDADADKDDDVGWSDDSTLCHGDAPRGSLISDRNYHSDSTNVRMPVGYENSAMKMSFSLSSLQPSSASLESPEHARLRADRPYNSLTKKPRKDPQQEMWRRSWGSREENPEEFWAAIQPSYAYLMDSELMERCADASGEMSADAAIFAELAQLKAEFVEIHAWLDVVRDAVYSRDENLTNMPLRVSHLEEMRRNAHRRQSFNETSASLVARSPPAAEEVAWRVTHLNAKWEMLEQALTPHGAAGDQDNHGTVDNASKSQDGGDNSGAGVTKSFSNAFVDSLVWDYKVEAKKAPELRVTGGLINSMNETITCLKREFSKQVGKRVTSASLSERFQCDGGFGGISMQVAQKSEVKWWEFAEDSSGSDDCTVERRRRSKLRESNPKENGVLVDRTAKEKPSPKKSRPKVTFTSESDEPGKEKLSRKKRKAVKKKHTKCLEEKDKSIHERSALEPRELSTSRISNGQEVFARAREMSDQLISSMQEASTDTNGRFTTKEMSGLKRWSASSAEDRASSVAESCANDDVDSDSDVDHHVRCLRKWLAEMESRLPQFNVRAVSSVDWTSGELEEKTREHMLLQVDIESHRKIVTSVVKLCSSRRHIGVGRRGVENAEVVARSLNNRWLQLYLNALEWATWFEIRAEKLRNRSPSIKSLDSEEGPATKYPRLSGDSTRRYPSSTSSCSSVDGDLRSDASCSDDDAVMDAAVSATPDSEMRVGKGKKRRSGKDAVVGGTSPTAPTPSAYLAPRVDASSELNTPNIAYFCFKHMDTDSEADARQQEATAKAPSGGSGNEKSLEDSSEEEWTFTDGQTKADHASGWSSDAAQSRGKRRSVAQRLEFGDEQADGEEASKLVNEYNQTPRSFAKKAPWKSSRESIQRLVIRADAMVMSTSKAVASRSLEPLVFGDPSSPGVDAKAARIAEWLRVHPTDAGVERPGDSCDASGEYTTGDSEDDRRSQSSDDVNVSVATCRQVDAVLGGCSRSNSSDAILDASEDTTSPLRTPTHVVMRAKRRQADRPWSVSGVGQLAMDVGAGGEPLAHFSISESALNQMAISPQGKGPALLGSGPIHNSSSTIDGTLMGVDVAGSGSRTGSLRRRKLRFKKRTLGRKSESGSDGVTVGHSNSGGSDSQQSKPITQSQGVEGSPRSGKNRTKTTTSSTSDSMLKDSSSDDDERASRRPMPAFKLGPEGGAVSFLEHKKLGLVGEEPLSHHSAQSEQAWDNYQEKYMSEPYSEELADSEAARRLLEFGDDYRNYLDSQSDCASSLGARHAPTPPRRRRGVVGERVVDSDSDLDEIRHVIQHSRSQLEFTEHLFGKQLANASAQLILAMDFAEIGATCRENVSCLNLVLESVETDDDAGLLSARECRDIRGLVERWELLQVKTEDLQRVRALQKEMVVLKDGLLDLAARVDGIETNLQDRDHLENTINQVKIELAGLRERKTRLLEVNVAVHRFLTDTGHPAAILKDDVADLYRVWDETYHSVSLRLTHLQSVSASLQQFDAHLSELQLALRADQRTLHMLDTELQGGAVTADVATSVRDVAKVLSEKREHHARHDALCQSATLLSDSATSTTVTPLGLTSTLSTEGSLSDSGISDEGSEQELSERERRLEALRRLARHLETVLAPGSAVLLNMAARIEQTEKELRGLQKACKDLIVRTAVCVEARGGVATAPATSTPKPKASPRIRRSPSPRQMLGAQLNASPDDDDDDPDKSRSWLWRIMRSALPFQLAMVALLCVACLLEPHCCNNMNTANFSFTPQLRYLRGSPPV